MEREIAISDVDLSIERGEIVTTVSLNRHGKSTLLRGQIGTLRLPSGTVTRTNSLQNGCVPQKCQIDVALSLVEHRFIDIPRRVTRTDANAASKTAGVSDRANAQMATLLGDQFQRVLLARIVDQTRYPYFG